MPDAMAGVDPWACWASALLLSIERLAYVAIWRSPCGFQRASERLVPSLEPVNALAVLFVAFKAIQGLVFVAWCAAHGDGLRPASGSVEVLLLGALVVALGQVLNLSVFARLGRVGVFYGNRLGHVVPWCRGFPFSWFRHPQYVGTLLSIWGFFFAMRFPAPDWIVLPLIETLYYTAGAYFEQDRPARVEVRRV